MAKYTIELYTMFKDKNFKVFDFEYEFYDVTLKEQFEKKFVDYFMFDEIGFETPQRFKHFLKAKLNLIMPYYKKLYETELASKDINFLLNKDLKETFIREIDTSDIGTSSSTINGTNNSTSSTEANSNSNSKESYLDNGNADVDLSAGNLTGVTGNVSQGTSSSTNNITESSTTTNDTSNTNKSSEKTELISQGNIGITSSAELLQKWRDTIVNIDNMIIDECKDLFMQIY